jgi:c-di-GMP-binding flagellar brake protein YcgR
VHVPSASAPPQDEDDRRRYRRVPVRLGVTYRSSTLTVDGQTVDLSLGGAFVTTSRLDPIGSEAEVILDLPQAEALELRGRVARVTTSGMGLVFEELARRPRLSLANLLLSSGL